MATINEIAQAEKGYADATARSGCVEFVYKSLSVLELLIDIGSSLVSFGRTLMRVRRFMEETGRPPIVCLQHAPVVTTDAGNQSSHRSSRPTRHRESERRASVLHLSTGCKFFMGGFDFHPQRKSP